MKITTLMVSAAALVLAGTTAAHATTNLLTNGDFENTGFGGTTSYYNLGNVGADHSVPTDFGWSVPVNNVDIVKNGSYGPYLPTGGAYNLDLVGYGSTGAISQTINTLVGQEYVVNLDYAANNGINGPTASVLIDGTSIGTLTGSNVWQNGSFTFVASTSTTTLEIQELFGANSAGVFLDNVSLSAVPEPATWTLMLVGFGMIGIGMRKRTTTKAIAALV